MKIKMHYMAFATLTMISGTAMAAPESAQSTATTQEISADLKSLNQLPATAAGVQLQAKQSQEATADRNNKRLSDSLNGSGAVFGAGI